MVDKKDSAKCSYDVVVLARRLKCIRIAKGYSQEDLARHASVSKDTVSSIESCRRGVTLNVVTNLATALGCTLEQLIGRADYILPKAS